MFLLNLRVKNSLLISCNDSVQKKGTWSWQECSYAESLTCCFQFSEAGHVELFSSLWHFLKPRHFVMNSHMANVVVPAKFPKCNGWVNINSCILGNLLLAYLLDWSSHFWKRDNSHCLHILSHTTLSTSCAFVGHLLWEIHSEWHEECVLYLEQT